MGARAKRCGTGSIRCSAVCELDSTVCSLVARTPKGGGVCGPGSCLHLLAGAGAQSRCGKSRCSQKAMGSAAVVHLFVSLQGRPPDLDAEKEGATSPDRSSLVAHTRRR